MWTHRKEKTDNEDVENKAMPSHKGDFNATRGSLFYGICQKGYLVYSVEKNYTCTSFEYLVDSLSM